MMSIVAGFLTMALSNSKEEGCELMIISILIIALLSFIFGVL